MSVKPCPSCRGPLAKSADACPRCGHKVRRTSAFTWLVAIFLGIPLFIAVFNGGKETHRPSPTPKAASTPPKITPASAEEGAEPPITDSERDSAIEGSKKAIQIAISAGYLTKVEKTNQLKPEVFTGKLWAETPLDFKNNVLKTVGALSLAERRTLNADFLKVTVRDGRDGKILGVWQPHSGLLAQ